MKWPLTVFDKAVVGPLNTTTCWIIGAFGLLAVKGEDYLCDDDDICTEFFMCNVPACTEYETFIGVIPEDVQISSIF